MATELFEAIEQHNLDRLVSLLERGADPNALQPQPPSWLPLQAAIEELEFGGSIEALVQLLRRGADVNRWDAAHDATPLLMALFRNQPEAVRMLLAMGADPNVVGGEGDSPLRWAVEQKDQDTAAMLLRCGAGQTIDGAGGPTGRTALGVAASQLNLPMLELLIAAGANPDTLDADHRTARERLPSRDTTNQQTWDAAAALLGSKSP